MLTTIVRHNIAFVFVCWALLRTCYVMYNAVTASGCCRGAKPIGRRSLESVSVCGTFTVYMGMIKTMYADGLIHKCIQPLADAAEHFNPSRVGTGLFRFNTVNIMAADALAPSVAKTSAPMIFIMWNKYVLSYLRTNFNYLSSQVKYFIFPNSVTFTHQDTHSKQCL